MSMKDKLPEGVDDPVVAQALRNFRASVNAWSEAELNRPRTVTNAARPRWRLAAAWALGCVLAAGTVSAGLFEHHHNQELTRIAAAQAAERAQQAKLAEEQQAAGEQTKSDDLLATVDRDISRQVPAAMEPLAQLMDDDGTK